MNFLRAEFLGMKDRLIAIESKTEKDSNPSGYATPESDQLGSLLRTGLDTHIPQSPKKGNNKGNKKSDADSDSKPAPVTKKVQQQNNHRKSLAALEREARVIIEPVVTASTAKDERQVLIKQMPSFKSQLRSLEQWSDFYLEVTKFQMTNETVIYAGAYVTNELIEELIEKKDDTIILFDDSLPSSEIRKNSIDLFTPLPIRIMYLELYYQKEPEQFGEMISCINGMYAFSRTIMLKEYLIE
jgi:hypothetical protein